MKFALPRKLNQPYSRLSLQKSVFSPQWKIYTLAGCSIRAPLEVLEKLKEGDVSKADRRSEADPEERE